MEAGDSNTITVSPNSKVTLQQRYRIRYHRPASVPVQLLITGNKLRILFFVRHAKNMFETFPGTNLTYADIAEAGIRENWSGQYSFPWLNDDGFERAHAKASVRILDNNEDPAEADIAPKPPSVRVTVEFIRYPDKTSHESACNTNGHLSAGSSHRQKFFPVRLSGGKFYPAHVVSPVWRWYWGFFRTFQLEALHLNWSRRHPGCVTLQKDPDRSSFQQICAHEIGHVLGLGDAYGANYRFFYEAPGTGSYMMCHSRRVQPAELEMVLMSHLTNRMQYFPWKFSLKTLLTGLRREYRLQFTMLSKNSKIRH